MKTIVTMLALAFAANAYASGSATLVCKDLSERKLRKGDVLKSGLEFSVDLGSSDQAAGEQSLTGPVKISMETGFDGALTIGSLDAAMTVDKKGKKVAALIGEFKAPQDENDKSATTVDIDLTTELGSKIVIKATDDGNSKGPVKGTLTFKLSKEEIKKLDKAATNDDGDPLTQVSSRENAAISCDTEFN